MAKVTSKLQVTIPKAVADAFGIRPGDDLDWRPSGEVIRVSPARRPPRERDRATRLAIFDAATERQRKRDASAKRRVVGRGGRDRGWTREELYRRGRAR